MLIVKPKATIETKINGLEILKTIERAGRTAYKSENKITNNSAENFVKMIISKKHFAVLEFFDITVRFICDRGVSHELVRHRLASFVQESTRYNNYSLNKFNKELTFIFPCFLKDIPLKDIPLSSPIYSTWLNTMAMIEKSYISMIENGATPQEARSVLPNSLKTEIVMKANLREWRHFFQLRISPAAHPQMREITIPLLQQFKQEIPIIFDDL